MPIIMGLMTSSAVFALARLGVPDHLESGPKSVEELSETVGAQPELLSRLMRATEVWVYLSGLPMGSGGKPQCPMYCVRTQKSP